ncbi:hypothetical protein HAX54_049366, partial [Datura stramonium]|nr:hypothetical protein [Datura stramonium]
PLDDDVATEDEMERVDSDIESSDDAEEDSAAEKAGAEPYNARHPGAIQPRHPLSRHYSMRARPLPSAMAIARGVCRPRWEVTCARQPLWHPVERAMWPKCSVFAWRCVRFTRTKFNSYFN